ncbi:hypothetical protein ERJ75_000379000 [Trypanosoma vivax]|uniref:Uncharacterized protein n=1 Tax=Trypanosoma vivax (strain Y486) TaxID=1055687 RepID=G0TRU8_TRYVY|nr:hypothetical protein TRVL_06243 [Trypanosoma vivax]KAH8617342.1 hypothetical protein ERJ75_000379000 [Trypanosoma vivax]CCC46670.1 conserved hypothetical protein [Trypanosoma vivax Y486]
MSSANCTVAKKVIEPFCRLASKLQARSSLKLASADETILKVIAEHNANGTDAAASSTKRYMTEQKQLFHYRVVRFFDECHYLASGNYFRTYTKANFILDVRFVTKVFFLFIVGTLVGRKSIFPPIDPDSPLVLALENKVNPNY